MPLVKMTCARLGGSCDGVRGIGGGAGVVGCVAGRLEGSGVVAEGLVCVGACASNDVESARLAAANRIGAKLCKWLVGRATTAEVTRRNDALLALV